MKIYFLIACLIVAVCKAQDVRIIPGKFTIVQKNLNENLDHISPSQLLLLKADIQKIQAVANEDEFLQSPKGYSGKIDYDFHKPSALHIPFQKALTGTIFFNFSEFYLDAKTSQVKDDGEFAGSIRISVNDLLFPSDFGPDNNMADADYPIPTFFYSYQNGRADSTTDYIEISRSNDLPFRVITNGKTLFAPLTKQQYLTYQIGLEKYIVEKWQKELDDQTQGLSASKQHFQNYLAKGLMRKGEYDSLMKTLDESIVTWKKGLSDSKQNLQGYQQQLSSLSSTEKNSPAFVDFQQQTGNGMDLVPDDDANKVGLLTPNPNYFNTSLPTTAIQLLVIRMYYHPTMTSPFMKEKINNAFQKLNYAKLKTLIQKW